MTQHKWHKEIKAWADGAEIEACSAGIWFSTDYPNWDVNNEFRIKQKQIPYWVCCGDTDIRHKSHCRQECFFGTADEHSKRCGGTVAPKQPKYLYAYVDNSCGMVELTTICTGGIIPKDMCYIGKIEV